MSVRRWFTADVLIVTALCAVPVAQAWAAESRQGGPAGDGETIAATLDDGATIQLVAVVRLGDSGPVAWHPDGTLTEIPDDWPDVLRVIGDSPTHGFILRFEGVKEGQGIGWDSPLTRPLSGERLDGLVSVSGVFPEVQTTEIRVGVLEPWGPWQAVEADGSITTRVDAAGRAAPLYSSIKSLTVSGKSKPLIALERDVFTPPLSRLAEYEVVAVDSQGERHRRKGVGILSGETAPYFDLTAIDLKHFEFRLRPYTQWVEFKNVPLNPAVPAVEVNVTQPQP